MPKTGVAFYTAILSALLEKPVKEQMVILGEMTIHGGLKRMAMLSGKTANSDNGFSIKEVAGSNLGESLISILSAVI